MIIYNIMLDRTRSWVHQSLFYYYYSWFNEYYIWSISYDFCGWFVCYMYIYVRELNKEGTYFWYKYVLTMK